MSIKTKASILVVTGSCFLPIQCIAAATKSPYHDAVKSVAVKSDKLQQQILELQKSLENLQQQQKELQMEQAKLNKSLAAKKQPMMASDVNGLTDPADILESEKAPGLGQPLYLPKTPADDDNQLGEPPQALYLNDTQTSELDIAFKKDASYPYGYRLLGNLGGTAVITSPFIHSNYDFKGANLIVNYSSINKDLSALRQRKQFFNHMAQMGLKAPSFPLVELSGELEGTLAAARTFSGRKTSMVDLTDAQMDVQALANSWFTGLMSFTYDNSMPFSGPRVNNARLFLDNGFITLGNLNKSSFYSTIGQFYVPFGQYDSYLISNPLNKNLFRIKARALTVGYATQEPTGANASLFVLQGETHVDHHHIAERFRPHAPHINTVGANWSYTYELGALGGLLGASVINNVADSLGMQGPGGSFAGFGRTEVLRHRVPGADARAEFFYEPFSLIGEYTTATEAFSPYDVTYNGHGAKPSAYHVEGVYSFDLFDRPSSFAIGYDQSYQALAFNVPKRRYAVSLNSSIWRNTLASIEFRHDIHYPDSDFASGDFGPFFIRPGKIGNAITGRLDVYF